MTVTSSSTPAEPLTISPSAPIAAAADPPAETNRTALVAQSLNELRSARRLEKVTASIESFLVIQVSRLHKSMQECQTAVDQNKIVQRLLADFQRQQEAWEREREAEVQRLYEASERLAKGWKKLEEERQSWLAERQQPGSAPTANKSSKA